MITRAEMFSGTETPAPHLQLDLATLRDYLSPQLGDMPQPLQADKFRGGQSNPTYLLASGDKRWVLRRRPPGKLLPSAHAIDREFRVMQAMAGTGVPVAQPLLYCADESVIGSEFYVAEYVKGRVFWDAEMPDVAPQDRRAVYDGMGDILARLHAVDIDAAGMADLGRHGGYCERNFSRWSKVYEESRLVDIPDMDWLIQQLPTTFPQHEEVAFIHGDYGLYNLIVHPSRPDILAVLDWEMATLGDPLIDLAHHIRAWWDIPDPQGSATSLADKDLPALGIPSMQDYVARYFAQRGMDAPDMTFYLAFAQFRYAAMIQGILMRVQRGTASGRTVHRQERVVQIARMARKTFEEGVRAA